MGEIKPFVMRPSDIRRLAHELIDRGCTVTVSPDGTIHASPVPPKPEDVFDQVDMRR